jgi:voltage-gated potassium channel
VNEEHSFKSQLFHTLEPYGENNQVGRWFDWFLILLIVCNVIAVMAETVPEIKSEFEAELFWFEVVSVVIFTMEYIARVWVCVLERQRDVNQHSDSVYRMKFMLRPVSVIDLLAILPFYLSVFISVDLRVLRLLRLTRMLKLGRYSSSMQTLNRVIANEYRVLIAALAIMMMIMIVAATGMYYLERHAQPEHFGSIPQALWWSVITLSTVGYGDVTPVTTFGRFFSGVFILVGVAIFALPAGILASSFSEQMSQKRDKFRKRILQMFASGQMAITKPEDFEYIRKRLGLTHEEAELLFAELKQEKASND